MTRKMRLTDANAARLKPEGAEYTVWDTRAAGLGVRVRPSGYRAYVYHDNRGRHTLGAVALMSAEAARGKCLAVQVRTAEPGENMKGGRAPPLFRDFVAGEWKKAHYDRCKPSTRKGTDSALKSQLLPAFGALPLERITPIDVNRWFDEYSATSPGGANWTYGILRQVLNHAMARGYLATNPARGVRMNPRPKLTRFLSSDEIRRLHQTLERCVAERPSYGQQPDIIRLLLLTGCRKGELLNLQWREVNGDVLDLIDSKTGPRRVFLNARAKAIIERQPRSGSAFVFPSPLNPLRPRSGEIGLWRLARKRAGLEGVRLHDLRHSFASHAVMKGVPLPVVARLLGHKQVRMTLRYAHVGEREVEAAAERIGQAITALMDI